MKAKKVVGRMLLKRESANEKVYRLDLLPRFLCLILAVILWLLIVNVWNINLDESSFFRNRESKTEQSTGAT